MKKCLLVLAGLAFMLATSDSASAGFRMRIEDVGGGVGVVVTDGGANDQNGAADAMTYIGAIGAFNITVTTGTATPGVPMANAYDGIDLTVVVSTTTGGTIRIILEKDGFNTAPDGGIILESSVGGVVSGPAGSTATFQSYGNAGNLVPTLGPDTGPPPGALPAVPNLPPAGSVAVYNPALVVGPGAFSDNSATSFVKSGPYSLFSTATIALTGAGSASFDHQTSTTPEPSSLVLASISGVGLFGAAMRRRRK